MLFRWKYPVDWAGRLLDKPSETARPLRRLLAFPREETVDSDRGGLDRYGLYGWSKFIKQTAIVL